jgi:hypothetical protein
VPGLVRQLGRGQLGELHAERDAPLVRGVGRRIAVEAIAIPVAIAVAAAATAAATAAAVTVTGDVDSIVQVVAAPRGEGGAREHSYEEHPASS